MLLDQGHEVSRSKSNLRSQLHHPGICCQAKRKAEDHSDILCALTSLTHVHANGLTVLISPLMQPTALGSLVIRAQKVMGPMHLCYTFPGL